MLRSIRSDRFISDRPRRLAERQAPRLGLRLVLLDGIEVTEERLLELVQKLSVEDEIADWLLAFTRL